MRTASQPRIEYRTDRGRGVLAQVTRCPLEVLDPAASLEGDLGIDSLKLREGIDALRGKHQFLDKPNTPSENYAGLIPHSLSLITYLLASVKSIAVNLWDLLEHSLFAALLPAAHVQIYRGALGSQFLCRAAACRARER
jgi:hypothetical protein